MDIKDNFEIEFKHDIPQKQKERFIKLIKEEIKSIEASLEKMSAESVIEEFGHLESWLKLIVNCPPDPIIILEDLLDVDTQKKTIISHKLGITLTRLESIKSSFLMTSDEHRRLSLVFPNIEWEKLYKQYCEHWDTECKYLVRSVCNMCGNDSLEPHEFSVHGKYSSEILIDETIYKFNICEICLEKIFYLFKVPPEIIER